MDLERWWLPFVKVVTLVWIVMFVVDISVGVEGLGVSESLAETNRTLLRWLLVVFLLDLVLLYRWSDQGPREFLRSNWFLVLTVIPWFRPLRAGRSIRALRLLSGSRRVGSFVNKIQGKCRSLWRRLRE